MTDIYLVYNDTEYDYYRRPFCVGVFSTEENAQDYIDKTIDFEIKNTENINEYMEEQIKRYYIKTYKIDGEVGY